MKKNFPEEGEIVLCTVKEIKKPQVFVNIDKYNKLGVIQFSEVAPGRIRNIREYVVPNKKIVCKVLRVFKESGHIDLSLRRVTAKERMEVMKEYTLNKDAESLLKAILKEEFDKIKDKILEKYEGFYNFLEAFMKDKEIAKSIGIKPKFIKEIEEEVNRRFKEKEVESKYELNIKSFEIDGLERIKKFIKSIENKEVIVRYVTAPKYEVIIKSKNYDEIEKRYRQIKEKIMKENKNFDVLEIKEIE